MKVFSRDDIRKARSPLLRVEIPEWDAVLYLRKWTAAERSEYMKSMSIKADDIDDPTKLRLDASTEVLFDSVCRLVAMTLCDENGERLYTDSPEDLAEVNQMEAPTLTTLFNAAIKLNGLEGEKAVEAELKNSETTQKSDSTSV